MSDMGWSTYISRLGDADELVCMETAIKNGHTAEEVDNCDDGSLGCSDCPFMAERDTQLASPIK